MLKGYMVRKRLGTPVLERGLRSAQRTARRSVTWCSDLRKKLHVQERGMAFKVLKLFSLLWQSFKGGNYSVWIALLPFLN